MANNGDGADTAKDRYLLNHEDVARLLELHEEKGGKERGRRYGLEVLNKSAIVLITAFWEAYCEDLAAEALERLVSNLDDPNDLPQKLRKTIADELKEDQHHYAVWKIAGDDWRDHVKSRLEDLRKKRNWDLMNPRPKQVQEMFADALGLEDVTKSWRWHRMTATRACEKLNDFVKLRGDVAHRGASEGSVKRSVVEDYDKFIERLVNATDKCVSDFVDDVLKKAT